MKFLILLLFFSLCVQASQDDIETSDDPTAVVNVAKPYGDYLFPDMEEWSSFKELKESFELARDTRFMEWRYRDIDNNLIEMVRRPTWLYPKDGCAERAEIMIKHMEVTGEPLYKVFAIRQAEQFKFLSPLIVGGFTHWSYHVAALAKYHGKLYVLDPALSPKKPIRLKRWLRKIDKTVDRDTIEIAICDAHTYKLKSRCYDPERVDFEQVIKKQQRYLSLEWLQVKGKGMDPYKVLGDSPPWKQSWFDKLFNLK